MSNDMQNVQNANTTFGCCTFEAFKKQLCVVFVLARGTMMEKQVKTKPMIDLNTTNGVCL